MSDSEKRKSNPWKLLWVWVIGAFALLIGAWSWLIVTASDNAPEAIPLQQKVESQ